ncbi:hypothetical protein [Methylobacterium sp. WSM2598]|uniref:beta strand repeat-containing protein n=1 Tax=Methylobacterium sp. WSM2598 TaxID=398261 RepID=UPI0003A5B982
MNSDDSEGYAQLPGLLLFANAFRPGGSYDVQTHYNGTSGNNVPAYREIASYALGVAAQAAGFSTQFTEWGGGIVNKIQNYFGNAQDVSGKYGNNPRNVNAIEKGFNDQNNGIFQYDRSSMEDRDNIINSNESGVIALEQIDFDKDGDKIHSQLSFDKNNSIFRLHSTINSEDAYYEIRKNELPYAKLSNDDGTSTVFSSDNTSTGQVYGQVSSFLGQNQMDCIGISSDQNVVINIILSGMNLPISEGQRLNIMHDAQNEYISGDGALLAFEQNSSGNVQGSTDTIILLDNSRIYVGVFGQNQTVTEDSGNNSINLGGNGTSATVAGGGYVGLCDSNQTLTLADRGSTVQTAAGVTGEDVTATNSTINFGTNATANIRGAGDGIHLNPNSGDYAGVFGQNQTVTGDSGNNSINLGGNGTSATVAGGGYVGLCDSNQTLTVADWSSTVQTAAGVTDEDVTATNSTVNFGANATANIRGAGDGIHLDPNAGDYAGVFGQNQTVTGDSGNNSINLGGDGTSATVYGGGYVGLCGSSQTLTLADWGSTAQTAANVTGESVTASNSTIGYGANASANIRGNGDAIHLNPNAGDYAGVYGQNQTVTGDTGNDTVNLGGNGTSATVSGGGYVGLCDSNQTLTLTDGGFTTDMLPGQAGETVAGDDGTINFAQADRGSVRGSFDTITGVQGQNVITFAGHNETINISNGDIEIDGPTYGDRFWGDDDSVFEDGRYIGGSGDNGEWDGEGDDGGWDEGGGWDDPIVLNLSGQPVRTVAAAQAGARFDARDDGRKVALGWGTPGEGYLVHLAPGKQAVTQDAARPQLHGPAPPRRQRRRTRRRARPGLCRAEGLDRPDRPRRSRTGPTRLALRPRHRLAGRQRHPEPPGRPGQPDPGRQPVPLARRQSRQPRGGRPAHRPGGLVSGHRGRVPVLPRRPRVAAGRRDGGLRGGRSGRDEPGRLGPAAGALPGRGSHPAPADAPRGLSRAPRPAGPPSGRAGRATPRAATAPPGRAGATAHATPARACLAPLRHSPARPRPRRHRAAAGPGYRGRLPRPDRRPVPARRGRGPHRPRERAPG